MRACRGGHEESAGNQEVDHDALQCTRLPTDPGTTLLCKKQSLFCVLRIENIHWGSTAAQIKLLRLRFFYRCDAFYGADGDYRLQG